MLNPECEAIFIEKMRTSAVSLFTIASWNLFV